MVPHHWLAGRVADVGGPLPLDALDPRQEGVLVLAVCVCVCGL